ncbi:cyclic nucleotide-binding domain protein [bacterium BMS3Abin14]|nr:cyclic nucleotide-binding domain protein [bacterium BMS3Abin14]
MAKIMPLRKSGMFQSLTDQELAQFARIVSEKKFERGAVLLESKAVSDRFCFIEKGSAVLTAPELESGGELVLGQWETFGEWALLGPEHLSPVRAVATDPSNILTVRRNDFEQFSKDHPATALKVQRDLLKVVWCSMQMVSELLGVSGGGSGV